MNHHCSQDRRTYLQGRLLEQCALLCGTSIGDGEALPRHLGLYGEGGGGPRADVDGQSHGLDGLLPGPPVGQEIRAGIFELRRDGVLTCNSHILSDG